METPEVTPYIKEVIDKFFGESFYDGMRKESYGIWHKDHIRYLTVFSDSIYDESGVQVEITEGIGAQKYYEYDGPSYTANIAVYITIKDKRISVYRKMRELQPLELTEIHDLLESHGATRDGFDSFDRKALLSEVKKELGLEK